MAGLQRSAVSFRRQGSSGLIFDDKFLSGELNKAIQNQQAEQEQGRNQEEDDKGEIKDVKAPKPVETLERSRSNGGGRGYRTGNVPPAIEPPSPRVSACGFCSAFSKPAGKTHRPKPVKRRSR